MDKAFKLGILGAALVIAITMLLRSENGRYSYGAGVVLDTRTGEYWTEDGTHFEPRAHSITTHAPTVEDEASRDQRMIDFTNCLKQGLKKPSECLAAVTNQAKPAAVSAAPEPKSYSADEVEIAPSTAPKIKSSR